VEVGLHVRGPRGTGVGCMHGGGWCEEVCAKNSCVGECLALKVNMIV
jgi:hypothetical protein